MPSSKPTGGYNPVRSKPFKINLSLTACLTWALVTGTLNVFGLAVIPWWVVFLPLVCFGVILTLLVVIGVMCMALFGVAVANALFSRL